MMTVFEVLINIFQGWIMIFFVNNVMDAQKRTLRSDSIAALGIAIFLTVYLFIDLPVNDLCVFAVPFLYSCFTSGKKWYICLFWTVLETVIFIESINLVSALFLMPHDVSWEDLMRQTAFRIAYLIAGNLAILLFLLVVIKIARKESAVSFGALALFIMLISLLLFIQELLFRHNVEYDQVDSSYTLISVGLLCATFIALLLYEVISTISQKRRQAELDLKSFREMQAHQNELKNMYTHMMAYQHDMRHQLQMIGELAGNKQNDIADIIRKATDSVNRLSCLATGSIPVDALLLAKKSTMEEKNILFHLDSHPLNCLPIDEMDFCVLLGNMLDNAIEAVERLPREEKPQIDLTMVIVQNMLYIVCVNPFRSDTLKEREGKLFSSKVNASLHGFGTESMKRICEKAGGQCRFLHTNEQFEVKIQLPYRQGQNIHERKETKNDFCQH